MLLHPAGSKALGRTKTEHRMNIAYVVFLLALPVAGCRFSSIIEGRKSNALASAPLTEVSYADWQRRQLLESHADTFWSHLGHHSAAHHNGSHIPTSRSTSPEDVSHTESRDSIWNANLGHHSTIEEDVHSNPTPSSPDINDLKNTRGSVDENPQGVDMKLNAGAAENNDITHQSDNTGEDTVGNDVDDLGAVSGDEQRKTYDYQDDNGNSQVGSGRSIQLRNPRKCLKTPKINFESMVKQINVQDSDKIAGRPRLVVLEHVCVDQEAIIVFDPALFDDHEPGALPSFDLSSVQYFYRHAPQRLVEKKLELVEHQTLVDGETSRIVKGAGMKYPPLSIRRASSAEVKALSTNFSECTIPLVFTSHWHHNFGEFFSAAVGWFWIHQVERKVLPKSITIAVHAPQKLPISPFVPRMLQPFSNFEVTSFADLSSRLPDGMPSNSTFEGTHQRCFRRLLLWRQTGGMYPAMPPAGRYIAGYYAQKLKELSETEQPFWSSTIPSLMRVLIEQRPDTGARQLLQLEDLLEACNSPSVEFSEADGENATVGNWPNYRTVECKQFEFGSKGFLYDIWVMSQADVLVSLHGAGQINSNFMPQHSSVIEIRGNHAEKMFWANQWNPLISQQSGFKLFWWGLFIEDPALVTISELEASGLADDAIRDQNVELRWQHLKAMLDRVAFTNKDPEKYTEAWGEKADHNVFKVVPGKPLPEPFGPLFS